VGTFLEKRPRRVWTFEEVFAAPVPGALHLVA